MNATNRSTARIGIALTAALVALLTGCETRTVHHTNTVYVPVPQQPVLAPVRAPAPPPGVVVQPPPPVMEVPPPDPEPVVAIHAESDFYTPLTPYGRWVAVGSYGNCWVPANVQAGWQPYSNGYWQRTDAGWYWVSDEPWGWATYHYGRWDFTPDYGWVWVPQTQWAPAWVTWREGGGYVGWAPLRPSVTINVNIGHADYDRDFAPRAYVFVNRSRMLEPVRPKTVIVNNTTIINKTVNITNVKIVNKTVINEGPRAETIEKQTGRRVNAVPVNEFRRKQEERVVETVKKNNPPKNNRPEVRPEPKPPTAPVVGPRQALPVQNPRPNGNPPLVVGQPPRQPVQPVNKPEPTQIQRPAPPQPSVPPRIEAPQHLEPRPAEKPSIAPKPAPVKTNPGQEKKHETVKEHKAPTPPVQGRPEIKSPEKPRTPAPLPVNKQALPNSDRVPVGRQALPVQNPRPTEHVEPNKKVKEDKEKGKKKGDDEEKPGNGNHKKD